MASLGALDLNEAAVEQQDELLKITERPTQQSVREASVRCVSAAECAEWARAIAQQVASVTVATDSSRRVVKEGWLEKLGGGGVRNAVARAAHQLNWHFSVLFLSTFLVRILAY